MNTNEHQLLDIWRRAFFYEFACRVLCEPIRLSKTLRGKAKLISARVPRGCHEYSTRPYSKLSQIGWRGVPHAIVARLHPGSVVSQLRRFARAP